MRMNDLSPLKVIHKKGNPLLKNVRMDWATMRRALVAHLQARGITNRAVLQAIARIPRHCFVPRSLRQYAYEDRALPIGYGQTISQPYTVARMLEALALQPGHRVLEIGLGSGYLTALLLAMKCRVWAIERIYGLFQRAQKVLHNLGLCKPAICHLVWGDGSWGLPAYAPYDRIVVSASVRQIPPAYLLQLRYGGCLVIPFEEFGWQAGKYQLLRITREGPGNFRKEDLGPFVFVPLRPGTEPH